MIILIGVISFFIGGMAWRVRGQSEPWGDTVARFCVWGMPVGCLILGFTHNPVYALAAVILAGLGASLGYIGSYDFTVASTRNTANYAKLCVSGAFRMFPLFLGAFYPHLEWHVLPAVLAGASIIPVYFAGPYIFAWGWTRNLGPYFNQWTCYSEFLFGGIIYSTLALGIFL